MALVDRDLSEPYSIFTYRYFLCGWPDLCILAYIDDDDNLAAAADSGDDSNNKNKAGEGDDWHGTLVGVIVGKADNEGSTDPKGLCGYIAMLAVETSYRRAGIGAYERYLFCVDYVVQRLLVMRLSVVVMSMWIPTDCACSEGSRLEDVNR